MITKIRKPCNLEKKILFLWNKGCSTKQPSQFPLSQKIYSLEIILGDASCIVIDEAMMYMHITSTLGNPQGPHIFAFTSHCDITWRQTCPFVASASHEFRTFSHNKGISV